MKVTVLGSGSIFFTRQLVKGMCESPHLNDWELALVDIEEDICERIGKFSQKAVEEYGTNMKITYTTDRLEALPGSDYVVLTFARENMHYRGVAVHLEKNFGITAYSGDTGGPGSIFRILRTIPEILEIAEDIKKLCPKATILNYVNPTNVVGAALDRHTDLKWYSFCDGMLDDYWRPNVCKYVGMEPTDENFEKLELTAGGINHCVWMWGLKKDGEDLWPMFKESLKKHADSITPDIPYPEERFISEQQMVEIFDAWPTLSCHILEYFRYFQGRGSKPERDYMIPKWDLNARVRWTRRVWREVDECLAGKASPRNDIMAKLENDMLARILDSITGDKNLSFPVNVRNDGKISNLPDDTIVEVYGRFGKDKVDIKPVGDLPRGPLGLTHATIDEQELALEASMTGDYNTLVRAIACNPLVMSLSDAKEIAYELMGTDEKMLPPVWDNYWDEGNVSGKRTW